ncbi:MAG TPA: hypothetical protein VGF18_08250 [Candidatus Tumulicola sp.]
MRLRSTAVALLVVLTSASAAARSQTAPSPSSPAHAELGIQLTAVGGGRWLQVRKEFFLPAVMHDIRDNLHATFVRIGWFPNSLKYEKIPWRREDQALDTICSSGLHVMFLLPSPKDDPKGNDDIERASGAFLDRYTHREFGCIRWVEAGNESDLTVNGFSSVDDYAAFYEKMAPIVVQYGVKIVTTGISGDDRAWTQRLAALLRSSQADPQVDGYGFHPYGVPPARMASATLAMRQAAGAADGDALPDVYVTEIGEKKPADLYAAIVNLWTATPAIALYDYRSQPGDEPGYAIKDNPGLYDAVVRAQACVYGGKCVAP